jgi:hypothetical protein
MKTTTTLLLLALLTSCSSSCAGNQPHVNWPGVVQCGAPIASELLGTVTGIIAKPAPDGDASSIGGDAVQALEQLAIAHGPEVIACLVNQAIASFDHIASAPRATARAVPGEQPANASAVASATAEQTGARVAAARGRDFLQRVAKTHVEAADGP